MNVPVAQLSAGVSAHVVDCPSGVVQWALRRAVAQFLDDSGVYRKTATFAGLKGSNTFALLEGLGDVPSKAYVRGVMAVRVDGRDVAFRLADSAQLLALRFALIRDSAVEADCLLAHGLNETMMDADLAQKYGSTICVLARSIIHGMADRPYSNPAAMASELMEYRVLLSDANLDRVRGGYGGDALNPLPEYF
jgi:hypothetical protein